MPYYLTDYIDEEIGILFDTNEEDDDEKEFKKSIEEELAYEAIEEAYNAKECEEGSTREYESRSENDAQSLEYREPSSDLNYIDDTYQSMLHSEYVEYLRDEMIRNNDSSDLDGY